MGTRTDQLPKPLINFSGRRLVDWQLAALNKSGVSDITIIRGYMPKKWTGVKARLSYNPDWSETNMVATIFCARELLNGDEPVLIAYGDIIYEPSVIEEILSDDSEICITVDRQWRALWELRFSDPLSDAESLKINAKGGITEIGGRLDRLEDADAQFVGLMKFKPEGQKILTNFYDHTRPGDKWLNGRPKEKCYTTDLLDGMINKGFDISASFIQGGWLEFDSSNDLILYERLERAGMLETFVRLNKF